MRSQLAALGLALMLLAPQPCFAVQPDEIMADAGQEARARALSQQLRCMVCQNQSIDDSDAPLARDLRLLVRERIARGDSDAQVIDFLVARYGAFVLLKPPFNTHTLILWVLPPLVLLTAVIVVIVHVRRRAGSPGGTAPDQIAPLTADEQARLAVLNGSSDAHKP